MIGFMFRRCKEVTTHEISAHHVARSQPRPSARLLLQQARAPRGAPPGRREEPVHAGFSGRARGRRPCGGEQAHRPRKTSVYRSEEHTSELQSQSNLVCRLLLEKKKVPHETVELPPSLQPAG